MQPAGPAPGLRYAGFWIRFLAVLIDGLILAIPIGAIVAAFVIPTSGSIHCTVTQQNGNLQNVTCTGLGTLNAGILVIWLGSLLLSGAYWTVCWSRWGQSLGQRLLGLHVVDAGTGGRISAGRALGRYVGYLVSGYVLYIGLIWAAFDPRKQGWHDKMASTFVVRRA